MLEKVSQVAEQVATRLSRRGFLGKAGQAALAVAGVLGGLLALSGDAHAHHERRWHCCCSPDGSICRTPRGVPCPGGTQLCRCPPGSGSIRQC